MVVPSSLSLQPKPPLPVSQPVSVKASERQLGVVLMPGSVVPMKYFQVSFLNMAVSQW
jgi:hypothetical protein